MKKIVIIGGGLSGLTAANRLRELRENDKFDGEFHLLEANSRLGGVLQTVEKEGFLLELGADAFLSDKPSIMKLAERLCITSELQPTNDANRRAFIVREGKLRAVPEGFQLIAPSNIEKFLASDIVDDAAKKEILAEEFVEKTSDKEADESLANFIRRRFGTAALERIAQPMLAGIYGANPEKLSLKATQARFLDLEKNFGSVIGGLRQTAVNPQKRDATKAAGARYSLFVGFRRGTQFLLNELAERLAPENVTLNSCVQKVSFEYGKWQITLPEQTLQADGVIFAVPSYISANLLDKKFDELTAILNSIEYSSCATINYGFRREQISHRLDGFGFVVPFVEGRNLMAGTFSSVKFAGRAPDGKVLIRAFVGGALQEKIFDLSDEEMSRRVKNDLTELLGISGAPLFEVIGRWRNAMPQYNVGHLEKSRRVETFLSKVPTLKLASTAFGGVGMPDAVRHGETAAEQLAQILGN